MVAFRPALLLLALAQALAAYAQLDAPAKPPIEQLPAGTRAVLHAYPGVQAHTIDGRVAALYGKPMTEGPSPQAAEAAFWAVHPDALGVEDLDLDTAAVRELSNSKFTVFQYKQRIAGLPVEYGIARLLVLNGEPHKVVYVSGIVAEEPETRFEPQALSAGDAIGFVSNLGEYQHLVDWSDPDWSSTPATRSMARSAR